MKSSRRLTVGLLLAVSLHAFDEMVLATAMPAISSDLGGKVWYGAAFSAYMLLSLVGVVLAGHTVDRSGLYKPMLVGLLCFGVGLFAASGAANMPWLVVARGLQGLGGGVISTIVFTGVNIAYPSERRPIMMSYVAAAWILPSLLAPLVGGLFVDYLNWRWIFIAILSPGAVTAWLVLPALKPLGRGDGGRYRLKALLDALRLSSGTALALAGFSMRIGPLSILMFVGAGLLAWRSFQRLMPSGLLRARNGLAVIIAVRGLLFFAFTGSETFLPLLLIESMGFTAMKAGLFISTGALSWSLAATLQARVNRLFSRRKILQGAVSLLLISIAALSGLLFGWLPVAGAYVVWGCAAFSMGLSFNILSTAAMDASRKGAEGDTSTAAGIADALGYGLAAGLVGAVYNQSVYLGGDLNTALPFIWSLTGGGNSACFIPRSDASFFCCTRS